MKKEQGIRNQKLTFQSNLNQIQKVKVIIYSQFFLRNLQLFLGNIILLFQKLSLLQNYSTLIMRWRKMQSDELLVISSRVIFIFNIHLQINGRITVYYGA
ncbi:unnamed protein product [Paramecium sonneborni]|uniref:Uncharacterized protein n=1 Tax=Paramecium sonneborni TaxID=65129 RepID=A0A8S1LL95_9CILI|nr:unnamed protein product [Paramecium sonneborni]